MLLRGPTFAPGAPANGNVCRFCFYDLSTFYARQYGLSPLGTHKCDFTSQITKRVNYLAMSHTSKSASNAMCKPSGNFTPIGIINTRFKIKKKEQPKQKKKKSKIFLSWVYLFMMLPVGNGTELGGHGINWAIGFFLHCYSHPNLEFIDCSCL